MSLSKGQDFLKAKLGQVSAKTLSLGGKQYLRGRNEQKIKFHDEFTYTPLSGPRNIRLLKIQEGSDTDVISCDVFEACLDEDPAFEALSYTWDLDPHWSTIKFDVVEDTKKEERPILCNGQTRHITMNLYHALTELRRRKLQVPIWADQVSINQKDVNEKASQLAIMADIYRSATLVTIWLGKLSMLRSQALDFMERSPHEPARAARTPSGLESAMHMETLSRSLDEVSSFGKSINEHYYRIIGLSVIGCHWFGRAWTLQEFLLATKFRLIMGNREVSPSLFVKAVFQTLKFWDTDQLAQRNAASAITRTYRPFILARANLFEERDKFQNGKRYSAEEYLGMIRTRLVTTMKDKVFAGAALLEKTVSSKANYHSTTLEVYMAYSLERLWPETRMFMLSLVGGTVPCVEGLPSWMPDLTMSLRPEPLRYCGCPIFKTTLLAQDSEISVDEKTVRAKAAAWDVVDRVGESIWSWGSYSDWPYNSANRYSKMRSSDSAPEERFGMMFALLDKLGVTYMPTGERTIDAFWQTLIGGANLKSEDSLPIWRDRFQQWFAFTLVCIRSYLRHEKAKAGKVRSSTDKWLVPLIADADKLEQRVSAFLDVHDPHVEGAATDTSDLRLRKTISHIMKRLLGVEQLEQSSSWAGSVAEMLANVRREDFYDPVSVFSQHFDAVYDGRRIFVTKRGYLGIAPEGVTAGDLIFFLAGADVPYVLRPVADQDRTFTLVGEAYVHGIMDGGDQLAEKVEFGPVNII